MSEYLVNRAKIRGLLKENNLSQDAYRKKLGISLNNFNDKINGKLQFTEKEIRVFFDDFGYQIFLPVGFQIYK